MQYNSRVDPKCFSEAEASSFVFFWFALWLAFDEKACFVGNTAFRSLCISFPRVRISDELGCTFSFLVRVVGVCWIASSGHVVWGLLIGPGTMIFVLSKEDCNDHPVFNSYLFLGSDVRPGSCLSMKKNNTKGLRLAPLLPLPSTNNRTLRRLLCPLLCYFTRAVLCPLSSSGLERCGQQYFVLSWFALCIVMMSFRSLQETVCSGWGGPEL